MDTNWAYIMAELCSRAYQNANTLNTLFKSSIIGSRAWTFNSANFIEDSATNTGCYLVTSGSTVAVVFRGSEVPGIYDMLSTIAGLTIPGLDSLAQGITKCIDNPANAAQQLVQSYLERSDWIANWYTNFGYDLVDGPWSTDIDDVQVHSGFFKAWSNVKTTVENQLTTILAGLPNSSSIEVLVTGHSLGGALATLAAIDITNDVLSSYSNSTIEVFTFGSPFVGNQAFADYYASCIQSKSAGSWTIRNRFDVIQYVNDSLSGLSTYADVDNGISSSGYSHFISKYIQEFSLPLSDDDTEFTPVYTPPSPTTPITSIVLRTITSNSYDGYETDSAATGQIIQWNVGLSFDPGGENGGPFILSGLYSDQIAPFFLPGQIDTFIVNPADIPSNLTVAALQQCILACSLPASYTSNSVSPTVLLDGLQLYINGYDFYTNYSLGIAFNLANTNFFFQVPVPFYLITGRSGLIYNINSQNPNNDGNGWGTSAGYNVLGQQTSSGIAWNTFVNPDAMGMLYTTLYVQPVFSVFQSLTNYQIVGGYIEVANMAYKTPPKPLSAWGQAAGSSDTMQPYSEGEAWNPYISAEGYGKSYFITRLVSNLANNLPNVIGGAMMLTDTRSLIPFVAQYVWGITPNISSIISVNTIPPNVAIISQGYTWNNNINSTGYQYTFLFFDAAIPQIFLGGTDPVIGITINSITCIQTSEYVVENNDEIFITSNGENFWPKAGSYVEISANETVSIKKSFNIALNQSVQYELWDYDQFTNDDELFRFPFSTTTLAYTSISEPGSATPLGACGPGAYVVLGENQGNGGNYYLNITVQ